MSFWDYMIVLVPLAFVYGMGWYSKRYVRGVVDFLAAGRLCGRYIISVASVAGALSVIGLVAYVEVHYKTGFALSFWNSVMLPLSVIMGLSGFFYYRFRETKAMSVGQFLEMRYSRNFRIFAAALRSLSEVLANMIMPAVAARFFIYFLDLPETFSFAGLNINTFAVLVAVNLVLAISIICISGELGIIITDSIQGLLFYPMLTAFVIYVLCNFSWGQEIAPALSDRAAGESFLNPYEIKNLRDFNFFFLGTTILAAVLHRGSWITSSQSCARSAHEQKMAGLLGDWRYALNTIFCVLIAVAIFTTLNHRNFSSEAKEIRNELCGKITEDIIADQAMRENISAAVAEIPEHHHTIGVDNPLSEKENLDTPYLNTVQNKLNEKANGNAVFKEFRTLYYQMMLAISMRHMLPMGMLGLFCLLMIMAMISTDDSRIYSAAGTIAQDVVLPLRKKPFTPEQHVWMIRWVSIGIGVFFFFGSFFMSQLDYINLFVSLMTIMWMGGCGPVMIFGMYSRFGNTKGAWTSLLTGMFLGLFCIYLQRRWAIDIYPFLENHGMVERVGNVLTTISRPFNPYIVWEMNPVTCPINSYELSFITTVITMGLYCLVSYLTGRGKEKFNLDRMLHRGIYAEGEKPQKMKWSFKNVISQLVGITPEYTRGDKFIAWGIFSYSFIYQFGILFLLVLVWNIFDRWSNAWWSNYFLVTALIIPGIIALITTFWFGIGGIRDMIRLFRDLRARDYVDPLDDGRVDGDISLADRKKFAELDKNKNSISK